MISDFSIVAGRATLPPLPALGTDFRSRFQATRMALSLRSDRKSGFLCEMTKSSASGPSPRWQRFLPWLGALIGLAVLAWLLRRFDFDRFLTILAEADIRYVMLIPLAIATEQLVRGWKWRQILYPLRSVGTLPLF